MPDSRTLVISLFLACSAMSTPVFAEESPAAPPIEMDTVTVTGKVEDQLTGSNTLERDTLERLPGRNGSLNEQLTILPGIQASELSRTSDNAGEILPPNLSISGGRFYDNNFVLDGIGNNSLLDPAFEEKANVDNVPGQPQELFVNPSLIDKITVYRFNVPARYGSFTGGVVEAETRKPSETFGGDLHFRHTDDEWTEFHYDDNRRAEFEKPISQEVQPEFDKNDFGLNLDIPLGSYGGLLLGYNQIRSDIPLLLLGEPQDQRRKLENYLFNYVNRITPKTTLAISGKSAPYEATEFLKDTLNSEYTISSGGESLSGTIEHAFDWGTLTLDLGYRHSENSREAPSTYFIWQALKDKKGTPTSKSWGLTVGSKVSNEGGYGDIEKEQTTYSTALHLDAAPISTGPVQHALSAGGSYEEATALFSRTQEMTRYIGSIVNTKVVCEPGAIDCISKEQFFYAKSVYPADRAETTIRFYDGYVEDTLTWQSLTVRPGLRLSTDDLQDNDNWAPRLALSYDLFGNNSTVLLGGLNRYYANTLLTYALAEEKKPYQAWRRRNPGRDKKGKLDTAYTALNKGNVPKPWADIGRTSINATRLTDLETPYSDEWVVGIRQSLFGGTLNLTYLERNNENELTTRPYPTDASGYKYEEWTNDGSSEHREATLAWEGNSPNQSLLLAVTRQQTYTSHSNYIDVLDPDYDGIADRVLYDGKIIERQDLPRQDFNREWTGTLTYIGRLLWGFTFTNVTRYRSGYVTIDDTGENRYLDSGEKLDIYRKIKNPESWIFDWRLDWERKLWREQSVVVSLEVNNVFDTKVLSGEEAISPLNNPKSSYDLGRQIWMGMTYKF